MEFRSTQDFFGKKVLIMGLGLHGGGVRAAQWFSRHGARVTVTDMKTHIQLSKSIDGLSHVFPDITYHLGGHDKNDFSSHDLIIQNPAVPATSPYLKEARALGVRIENELSFFFLMTKNITKIGVTGTRGKSTTATLISEILKKKYPHVYCAGVATGTHTQSFFHILDSVLEDEQKGLNPICVLECSSFQLEALNEQTGGPHIAVITNVYLDHLNRYVTLQSYIEAKKRIYQFQDTSQYAVLNYDNASTRELGMQQFLGKRYWFSRDNPYIDGATIEYHPHTHTKWFVIRKGNSLQWVCPLESLQLAGEHNVENALATLAVCASLDIPHAFFEEGILSFRGVVYRQEFIGVIKGRSIINDTTATSPDGLIAALKVFGVTYPKKIILCAGGNDKNLVFDECAKWIRDTVKEVILCEGTATQKFCEALDIYHIPYTRGIESMKQWVECAFVKSSEGDCILLSPGCASFGIFQHEFDRGEQFNTTIKTYQ